MSEQVKNGAECQDCGMWVEPHNAYHPYAACLMFKACRNGNVVTENLNWVLEYARASKPPCECDPLAAMDWNRLLAGDQRALDPAHQPIFDRISQPPAVACAEMHMTPERTEMVFQGELPQLFAEAWVQFFKKIGGVNFVTCSLTDPETLQRYEVTMQRAGAKTPADELAEHRATLRAQPAAPQSPLDEPVARLMNWIGPGPEPSSPIARTFLEFPRRTPEDRAYWEEGEPLYTRAALAAHQPAATLGDEWVDLCQCGRIASKCKECSSPTKESGL